MQQKYYGWQRTVTVMFSQAAVYPDVRILECKGRDDTRCDGGGEQGSTGASGNARRQRQSANELIFGAEHGLDNDEGSGEQFTSRVITTPDKRYC